MSTLSTIHPNPSPPPAFPELSGIDPLADPARSWTVVEMVAGAGDRTTSRPREWYVRNIASGYIFSVRTSSCLPSGGGVADAIGVELPGSANPEDVAWKVSSRDS